MARRDKNDNLVLKSGAIIRAIKATLVVDDLKNHSWLLEPLSERSKSEQIEVAEFLIKEWTDFRSTLD